MSPCLPEHLPGAPAAQPQAPRVAPQQTPPRPRAPRAPLPGGAGPPPGALNVAAAYPQRPQRGWLLARALRLPLAVLRAALGAVASVAQVALAVAAFTGDRVLPRGVMQALRGERGLAHCGCVVELCVWACACACACARVREHTGQLVCL
jgi:hypothetical protein